MTSLNYDDDQLWRQFEHEEKLRQHLQKVCERLDRCWDTPLPDSPDSELWAQSQMYSGNLLENHVLAWFKRVNDARLQTRLRKRLKMLDPYMPAQFRLGIKFEPRSVRSAYFGLIERYKSRALPNGFITDPICDPVEVEYYPNHDESPLKSQTKLKKFSAAFLACMESFNDWQDHRERPVRSHTFLQRFGHILATQYEARDMGLFKDRKDILEREEWYIQHRDDIIIRMIEVEINANLSDRPDDFRKWSAKMDRIMEEELLPEPMEPKNKNRMFITGKLLERIERECKEKGSCLLEEKDLVDRSGGKTPNIFS